MANQTRLIGQALHNVETEAPALHICAQPALMAALKRFEEGALDQNTVQAQESGIVQRLNSDLKELKASGVEGLDVELIRWFMGYIKGVVEEGRRVHVTGATVGTEEPGGRHVDFAIDLYWTEDAKRKGSGGVRGRNVLWIAMEILN